jgi:hypothetical protein
MVDDGRSPRVRRVAGTLWRDLPDSVMVLRPDDSVVKLTGPGRALWLVLAEPATVAELEQAFAPTDLVAGLRDYLAELEQLGLVAIEP